LLEREPSLSILKKQIDVNLGKKGGTNLRKKEDRYCCRHSN